MKNLKYLALALVALLALGAQVIKQGPISSAGSASSVQSNLDACANGAQGGGWDPATETFAWTCGNWNGWTTIGYEIQCTGDGTGTGPGSAPLVAACFFGGYTLKINAAQDMLEAQTKTRRGGKIYMPSSVVYLNRGCGQNENGDDNTCPSLTLEGIPLAGVVRGAVQSLGGRQFVGEGGIQTYDPIDLGGFQPGTTWWIQDTGDGGLDFIDTGTAALGYWGPSSGVFRGENFCSTPQIPWINKTTKYGTAGYPSCDYTGNDLNLRWPMTDWARQLALLNGSPVIADTTDMTFCLEDPALTSKGVCTQAPWIRCSNNNASSSANCDFDDGHASALEGGADVGPCISMLDLVQNKAAAGEEVRVGFSYKNTTHADDTDLVGGTTGAILTVDSVSDTDCVTTGTEVTFKGEWPFNRTLLEADNNAAMYVIWDEAYDHVGGGWDGFNFIPRHYWGIDHSDESIDCSSATEATNNDECDTKALMGLFSGEGHGFQNFSIHRASAAAGSVLDGEFTSDYAESSRFFRNFWIVNANMIGSQFSDMSGWEASNGTFINPRSQGTRSALFNFFADNGIVRNMQVRGGTFGAFARVVNGNRNLLVENIEFHGVTWPYGVCTAEAVDGFECRGLRGNNNGPLAYIAPRDSAATPVGGVRDFKVHDFNLWGNQNTGDNVGGATGTSMVRGVVILTDENSSATYDGQTEDVRIYDGTIRTTRTEVILVAMDGDDTATDEQHEADRDEIAVENVTLYSGGSSIAQGLCDIDNSTSCDAGDVTSPLVGLKYPRLNNVVIDGVNSGGLTDDRIQVHSLYMRDTSVAAGNCMSHEGGGQGCTRSDAKHGLGLLPGRVLAWSLEFGDAVAAPFNDGDEGCLIKIEVQTNNTTDTTSTGLSIGSGAQSTTHTTTTSTNQGRNIEWLGTAASPGIPYDAGDVHTWLLADGGDATCSNGTACDCSGLGAVARIYYLPDFTN